MTGLLALLVGGLLAADVGRYQVIIDRDPFGGLTGTTAPGATPSALARFAFVGLVTAGDGLQAIIQDKQTRQCYFKTVGETIDDVKVVRIEDALPNRKLVLQRGLETATLVYEQRRAAAPPAPMAMPPTGIPMPGGVTAAPEPPLPTPETGVTMPPPPPRRIPFRR